MQVEIKSRLYDILNAIQEIDSFLLNGPKDFTEYQADIKTKRAIERNFTIIGEAMSRILKADSSLEISYSRRIVDFRNRVFHGYDSISDEAIWEIVVQHLPTLQTEISALLGEV